MRSTYFVLLALNSVLPVLATGFGCSAAGCGLEGFFWYPLFSLTMAPLVCGFFVYVRFASSASRQGVLAHRIRSTDPTPLLPHADVGHSVRRIGR